jgi:hypothetical protein
VRVITSGASPVLPLRMVAAGTGSTVSVILYVIGEGRWAPENFPEAAIPLDLLSWDFASNESNYGTLRDLVLGTEGGRGWLTAYARQGALFEQIGSPNAFFQEPQEFDQVFIRRGVNGGSPDLHYRRGRLDLEVYDPCSRSRGRSCGTAATATEPTGSCAAAPRRPAVALVDITARRLAPRLSRPFARPSRDDP